MTRRRSTLLRAAAGTVLLLLAVSVGLAVGVPAAAANTSPVLVIAAHPDDEALGSAGVIEAALDAGRPVYVVVVTNGSGAGCVGVELDVCVWCGDGGAVGGGAVGVDA